MIFGEQMNKKLIIIGTAVLLLAVGLYKIYLEE